MTALVWKVCLCFTALARNISACAGNLYSADGAAVVQSTQGFGD